MEERAKWLEQNDKQYIWHPFTQMQEWLEATPVIIEGGKGIKLTDTYGREYYDGVSSLWLNVHGHRKSEIDQAIIDQLGKIAHSTMLGLANVPAVELARELIGIIPPGLKKVFYSDSGSEAVEIALKMAFQYWQHKGQKEKTKFITLTNAYHGDTIGAVSVGGIDIFHKIFHPLLFQTYHAPSPYCYRCSLGMKKITCKLACLDVLEDIMRKKSREVAAMIIEPLVQGAGGMIVAPPGYLKRVRELCSSYQILLIADEVATGFGRTGRMFACEQEEVNPDLMTAAKGITGGYLPLAATFTTEEIYQTFLGSHQEMKTFFHGHSYTGNPLACAAALANLELFKRENILWNAQKMAERVTEILVEFEKLEHVGEVRQCGLMIGIELVKDRITKEPYPLEDKMGVQVCLKAREMGMIIRPLGDVVVFMPPLCSTEPEIEEMLRIIYLAVKFVTG